MQKKLLALVAFLGGLILFFLLKHDRHEPDPLPEPGGEIAAPNQEILNIVENFAEKSDAVRSVYCKNMPISLRQGRQTFSCLGELAYEKPRNFRLIARHRFTGEEMDIGSNSSIFWFWSKRMSPPSVYFCKHENYPKSQLKSALNPEFLTKSLGHDRIELKDLSGFSEDADNIFAHQKVTDGSGSQMDMVYVLSRLSNSLEGIKIIRPAGSKVASTHYRGGKIFMEWPEEDMSMIWDMSSSVMNTRIPKSYWAMPKKSSTIEMGE